jgi:glycine/D-amino acid oxidase-like deaminating enzyme
MSAQSSQLLQSESPTPTAPAPPGAGIKAPVSYWWTTRSYVPDAPLETDTTADVAIIGGGFTGLSTAYHLQQLDPSLSVLVLEQEAIGYGASGRSGGFGMTLFGLSLSLTRLRFGADRTRQAHHYMEQAVDHLWHLIQQHALDCDAERPGFLRLATTPAYARRIQHDVEVAHALGLEGIDWLTAAEVRRRVESDGLLGAWWEPRCVLLNPAKLAWEMKRVVKAAGVRVAEQTPVAEVRKVRDGYQIRTPRGTVQARKIAFATNAFSAHFPQLRAKQVPVYTHIVLTEPLEHRVSDLGWCGREGLEDARNLIHYFRLTADNRLLMGGGDVGLVYGGRPQPNRDRHEPTFDHLERFIQRLFPSLQGVKITHRWGGPVSVTVDMAPALGYLGHDRSAVYSLGCIGHGVSMTQYNGWTLAELLLERASERTEAFFVNRWTIPWPPEPLRFGMGAAIRQYMRWEDRRTDQNDTTRCV